MHESNIARINHQINKAICQSVGDNSQADWSDAPGWQRQSAIQGVLFMMNNPDAPPSALHDEWMKSKLADGWIHGEVKDPELKIHPCLVDYDSLPPEQRVKDYVFKELVRLLKDI